MQGIHLEDSVSNASYSTVPGCMDSNALNYDSNTSNQTAVTVTIQ